MSCATPNIMYTAAEDGRDCIRVCEHAYGYPSCMWFVGMVLAYMSVSVYVIVWACKQA